MLQAARAMIKDSKLGRVVAIAASSTVLKPDAYYDVAWRREPGGGPVLINLVHDIDALRFLCGEIDTVQALVANHARGLPVEETTAVLLRFQSGALATIMLSDATPSLTLWRYPGGRGWDQRLSRAAHPVAPRDTLEEQTLHFLRVVRREVAPIVSGRDGARTVAATLAVGQSAATGAAVRPEEPAAWGKTQTESLLPSGGS